MATEPACLLIADISGYTGYLSGVELDHAQDILADLIGAIIDTLRPSFRLAKLEGDAVFAVAPGEQIDGSLLLDTVEQCYFRFRRRRRDIRQATSCPCNACAHIPDLNLKFVVHHGAILRQHVAGNDELLGPAVILVHRLLKNGIVASTGIAAYAVFSQQCVDAMDVDVDALGMLRADERYEDLGTVAVWVHDLERRWREEEDRIRVRVDERDERSHIDLATSAPASVAWEFATAPGRRLVWQEGLSALHAQSVGNRRGVGTITHCEHGTSTIVEEVLDWHPYDYVTLRSTMPTPLGPVRLVTTTELEPTPDGGTIIHYRIGSPETARERIVMRAVASRLDASLRASAARLEQQLETESMH
ncbi:DUF2652 domain-containing protein [Agromyces sp. NPDC056523]|uniref:DUF2652 domain-containing protein n=1 Tax=Agromyces sp. NPDC056523 TaxID=3345850 RepID=UPI00366FFA28